MGVNIQVIQEENIEKHPLLHRFCPRDSHREEPVPWQHPMQGRPENVFLVGLKHDMVKEMCFEGELVTSVLQDCCLG